MVEKFAPAILPVFLLKFIPMKPPVNKRIVPAAFFIKKSRLPGAGKGLFTRDALMQGQIIIEYKGRITTYKEVQQNKTISPYVYFVNNNYVIDAMAFPESLGRYANDANGMQTFPGLINNAQFILLNKKVYLQATADMPPGAEIFVSYGKAYWNVIKTNLGLKKKDKGSRTLKSKSQNITTKLKRQK
jgi:uncharacterized protein